MKTLALIAALGCGNVASKSSPDAPQRAPDAADGCAAGAFLRCSDPMTATFCSADGHGTVDTACGAPGCNAGAQHCNQCVPGVALCSADGSTLEMCGTDGVARPMETCALSCADATSTAPARCKHIITPYATAVCDTPATTANLALMGGTIDPGLDGTCSAIVTQTNGPDICVVRADTISIASTVTVVGPTGSEPNRAIAFVADHDLVMSGTLDLSAHGTAHGPGGGTLISGVPGTATSGGGGAGAFTTGGNGANDTNGNGGAGGAATGTPLPALMGGANAGSCSGTCVTLHPFGGAGGGAVMLASCLETVTMSGSIVTSGGGGQGARLNITGSAILAPDGGGAGGNVVIAGAGVQVTGSLFANGGGGGGGCNNQTGGVCPGGTGADGPAAVAAAAGGAAGTGATGGAGGFGSTRPGVGNASGLIPSGPGGAGGGAAGHLQVWAPSGVVPTVTPAQASPPFDPLATLATK